MCNEPVINAIAILSTPGVDQGQERLSASHPPPPLSPTAIHAAVAAHAQSIYFCTYIVHLAQSWCYSQQIVDLNSTKLKFLSNMYMFMRVCIVYYMYNVCILIAQIWSMKNSALISHNVKVPQEIIEQYSVLPQH